MSLGIRLLIFPAALALAGCNSESQKAETPGEPLAISGTWSITGIDLDTGLAGGTEGATTTLTSNNAYSATYSPTGYTAEGTIEKYDNTACYVVVKVTRDDKYPSNAPYIEKIGWQLHSPTTLSMYAYEVGTSVADAESKTRVVWGPTPDFTKQ